MRVSTAATTAALLILLLLLLPPSSSSNQPETRPSSSSSSSDSSSPPRTDDDGPTTTTRRQNNERRPPPNIVFLVCESTDGRTWRHGYQNGAVPLPNLRSLSTSPGGASFHRHYANAPVCCPSRASLWSGRHPHRIPHLHNGLDVGGAWNNYEGLPRDYADRLDQILSREGGYDVYLSGKTDWAAGGHTLNVRLGAWTKQVRFPYDLNRTGGWREDYASVCRSNGTVIQGNRSAHGGDWATLERTVDWIRSRGRAWGGGDGSSSSDNGRPFFAYQGMNIVHPPYATNEDWYSRIDPTKIDVPPWPDLNEMHPCDLQSSMLKGCVPSTTERRNVTDYYRRRNVRRIYYATIAEFDAMVGRYVDAVREAGLEENTVFIITSDHGDMQTEHRQVFKMVPYDGSSTVPMVVYDPRRRGEGEEAVPPPAVVVTEPTQLIDVFPTVLELAGIDRDRWPKGGIGGMSLLPLLDPKPAPPTPGDATGGGRSSQQPLAGGYGDVRDRSFVVSQFHGMFIAMSWFLIVKKVPPTGRTYKLVQYGTGSEVSPQLFDLTSDPDELTNLARDPNHADTVADLDSSLRSVVDYPAVAREVAVYDRRSFRWWMGNVTDWRGAIRAKGLRWTPSWDEDSDGAFDALEDRLNRPDDEIVPCRSEMRWPPVPPEAHWEVESVS